MGATQLCSCSTYMFVVLGIIQYILQNLAIMCHRPITHRHSFSRSCGTLFKRKSQ